MHIRYEGWTCKRAGARTPFIEPSIGKTVNAVGRQLYATLSAFVAQRSVFALRVHAWCHFPCDVPFRLWQSQFNRKSWICVGNRRRRASRYTNIFRTKSTLSVTTHRRRCAIVPVRYAVSPYANAFTKIYSIRFSMVTCAAYCRFALTHSHTLGHSTQCARKSFIDIGIDGWKCFLILSPHGALYTSICTSRINI